MSNRKSVIRKTSTDNTAAAETMYVVDLYEDNKLVMVHAQAGSNYNLAESVARNWETGSMQMLTE